MYNKIITISLVLIFGISLSGCQKVLFMHYQIKKPKVENAESITSFAEKNGLDNGEQLVFSMEGFQKRFKQIRIPGIEIYTKDGKHVPYPRQDSCSAKAGEFLGSLQSPLQFPTSNALNLFNVLEGLATMDGQEVHADNILQPESDYVVTIYWANFLGKLNAEKIDEWKTQMAQNTHTSFDILMVNCDVQESWDMVFDSKNTKFTK